MRTGKLPFRTQSPATASGCCRIDTFCDGKDVGKIQFYSRPSAHAELPIPKIMLIENIGFFEMAQAKQQRWPFKQTAIKLPNHCRIRIRRAVWQRTNDRRAQ